MWIRVLTLNKHAQDFRSTVVVCEQIQFYPFRFKTSRELTKIGGQLKFSYF